MSSFLTTCMIKNTLTDEKYIQKYFYRPALCPFNHKVFVPVKKKTWLCFCRRVSIHLQHLSKQVQNTECKWRCTAHYSTHLGPCQHPCSSLSVIASTKHPGGLKTAAGFPSEPPHTSMHWFTRTGLLLTMGHNALCERSWDSFLSLLPDSVSINMIKRTKGAKRQTSTTFLPCFMVISLKGPVRSCIEYPD